MFGFEFFFFFFNFFPGTYRATYTPKHSGPTTINVTLGDEGHVAQSPYHIEVQPKVDTSNTFIHGPGLEDGILDTQPTHFIIETRDQDNKPLGKKGAGQPFDVSTPFIVFFFFFLDSNLPKISG